MDLNDYSSKLQALTGVAMTDEEKESITALAKTVVPMQTDTDRLEILLKEKGLNAEEVEAIIEQAKALLGLWLLRYIFDNTTEDERKNIEIAAESLSPTQTNELMDVLMEKKIGKSMADLSDELWAQVVDAFVEDIETIINDSKR
ncbi:hypothetical protein JW962_03515 [Candidatus Dojkabacteria bacterium]|nr:hypothetical protein [Candidatus Dojkabacteria bacterium]